MFTVVGMAQSLCTFSCRAVKTGPEKWARFA